MEDNWRILVSILLDKIPSFQKNISVVGLIEIVVNLERERQIRFDIDVTDPVTSFVICCKDAALFSNLILLNNYFQIYLIVSCNIF